MIFSGGAIITLCRVIIAPLQGEYNLRHMTPTSTNQKARISLITSAIIVKRAFSILLTLKKSHNTYLARITPPQTLRHQSKRFINDSFCAGSCRALTFQPSLSVANGRLKNHTIKNYEVHNMHECEWICYQEHDCVSVNFETKANPDGKQRCELNNSTHAEHGKDLINDEDYIYRGTEVRHSV